MKTLSIIGSTGSIGTQALDIIRHRADEFRVVALSAGSNFDLLVDQIKEFKPQYVTILSDDHKAQIKELFPDIEVLADIKELAEIKVDIFLSAIVGIAGLAANLEALKRSKRVAVANKETLVSAGHLVRQYCSEYGSELIPVDSEHVAIHQCLYANADHAHVNAYEHPINKTVKEILLTSSGGPFRTLAQDKFTEIKLADALKHPSWNMGAKITVDSSTLMNKALEIIEVNSLFGFAYDQIKVVIHPQSIVHSAVTFIDGNTMAQLGAPDMRVPIQYAMDFPNKKALASKDDFDIFKHSQLEFYEPDRAKFPALDLAYKVGELGASYPAVFNSANEAAVELFLKEQIHYLDIMRIVEKAVAGHNKINEPSLDEIQNLDKEIKESVFVSFKELEKSI